MKNKFILVGLVCLALGLVTGAKAAVENEFAYYPQGTTTYSNPQTVPQFSTSLGTLDAVYFTFTENVSDNITFKNNASQFESVTQIFYTQVMNVSDGNGNYVAYDNGNNATIGGSLLSTTGTQPSGVTYVAGSHGATGYWTVAPNTSDSIPLGYNETYNYALTPTTTGDASGFTLYPSTSGAISAYVGGGTVPVTLNSSANVLFNGNGNVTYSSTVDVAGTMEVTYLYSTVPEPGTWMAAGLLFGVVGLHTGRCLWRRKNQNEASLKA